MPYIRRLHATPVGLILFCLIAVPCLAQSNLPRFGIQAKASTLGAGIEAATAVSARSNVRFGFNALNVNFDETKDGIDYNGTITLRSVQATFDYYLFGGFHVSPGVLLYNGNKLDAVASVPGGSGFSLGNTFYMSDPKDPVRGTGGVSFNKAAPMLLLGVGNLLPRSGRHFTVNFDFGVVFQGSPEAALNLTSSTCDPRTGSCLGISSNPAAQASIQAEVAKINEDLKPFEYYPVLSLGIGYRF